MVVKRLLDGRFQFIRVVSTKQHSKTYLMVDCNDPSRSKCIVKHLHLPTSNPIALKSLAHLLNKRAVLLRQLGQHEAIADTLATLQEGQDYYWIRSYISGHSLREELTHQQPWAEGQVIKFLKEILTVLEFIQQNHGVHQNLHPDNIIRHTNGQLILVDFWLAQESERLKPTIKQQANGAQLSPRHDPNSAYSAYPRHRQYPHYNIDHFALGMIAFQGATGLLTEALPGVHQADFLDQIKLQLDECSNLSDSTKKVLLGMLSPNPSQNFRQAKTILEQLNPPASTTKLYVGARNALQPTASSHASTMARRPSTYWFGLSILLLSLFGILLWFKVPNRIKAMRLSQQASEAHRTGQLNDAIHEINQALQLQPQNGKLFVQRAEFFWEQADTEAALQDLTQAIQVEPNNPEWYFQRGNYRLHLGDFQGAIADYTDAIQRDNSYGAAYINRGSARAERGDEAGAVEDYTAALNLVDDLDQQASTYLNRCLSLSNLGNQAAALADCTTAINLSPNSSLAYENRGLVKRRLNDLEGALRDFTIAIQIDPGSSEPYYNRGLTRAELGDLEGALEDFQQTIELNPDHPFVYYDRGLLYVKQGDFENATADFEKASSYCLDVGRLGCFEDAQYQIEQIQSSLD